MYPMVRHSCPPYRVYPTVERHCAAIQNFEEGKAPQDVGFAFAGVWQGMIDVARTVADIKLPLDVNVSEWSSPSEPDRVGE